MVPPRSERAELLDRPGLDPGELAGNLRDLARINRWFGGTRIVLRALERLVAAQPPGADLWVLDVATGGGDVPLVVARWARRRGLRPRIVATDLNRRVLAEARRGTAGEPAIRLVRHDAVALSFRDRSFDVALCSLTAHHLPPDGVALLLHELRRVARLGFVLNDLERSWPGWIAAWLATRLISRNRLTRHDGPLSVRRAYTVPELAGLARRASVAVEVRRAWPFRLVAVGRAGAG